MMRFPGNAYFLASFVPLGLAFTGPDAARAAEGRVLINVSVDWKGRDLAPANLAAMSAFREAYPGIPLIHFLNAAYFTKPGADSARTAELKRSVLRPGDEHGLHIHGWKTNFEAAGVKYRSQPSFFAPEEGESQDCSYDCGHDIPISLYTEAEMRKVVRFSIDRLVEAGFERAVGFRAGGWMAPMKLLNALAAEGIRWDSSEVPTSWLQSELNEMLGLKWIKKFWPKATPGTQPHTIATKRGPLVEYTDNGGLADYLTAADLVDAFDRVANEHDRDPSRDLVLHIGFHQESAARYLPRFRDGLERLKARAAERGITVEFPKLPLKTAL